MWELIGFMSQVASSGEEIINDNLVSLFWSSTAGDQGFVNAVEAEGNVK